MESEVQAKIKQTSYIQSNVSYILYICWFLLTIIIISLLFQVLWGPNSQGDSCDSSVWNYGKKYQWIDGIKPCIFTFEFYFSAYICYFIVYLLYDFIRYKIIRKNLSLKWRISEIGSCLMFYWSYLLWLIKSDYGILNWTMLQTSFLGMFELFMPLFLVSIVIYFIYKRALD
jgi:hypothetical protein